MSSTVFTGKCYLILTCLTKCLCHRCHTCSWLEVDGLVSGFCHTVVCFSCDRDRTRCIPPECLCHTKCQGCSCVQCRTGSSSCNLQFWCCLINTELYISFCTSVSCLVHRIYLYLIISLICIAKYPVICLQYIRGYRKLIRYCLNQLVIEIMYVFVCVAYRESNRCIGSQINNAHILRVNHTSIDHCSNIRCLCILDKYNLLFNSIVACIILCIDLDYMCTNTG